MYSVAADTKPVRTLHGLTLLPDRDGTETLDMLPGLSIGTAPAKTLDQALTAISWRYGNRTARLVALEFEYPGWTAP